MLACFVACQCFKISYVSLGRKTIVLPTKPFFFRSSVMCTTGIIHSQNHWNSCCRNYKSIILQTMVTYTTTRKNTCTQIEPIITNKSHLLLFFIVRRDLSVFVNQPCQPWQSSRCLLLPQKWQERQEERKSGEMEREGESMNTMVGHHWTIKVRAQRTDVDKH